MMRWVIQTVILASACWWISQGTAAVALTQTPSPSALARSTPAPTPLPAACVGDCNGDDAVTIDELILGVNIELGNADIGSCPSLDCCGNLGSCIPGVTCLIRAVGNALYSCEGTPTPTPGVGACQPPPAPPSGPALWIPWQAVACGAIPETIEVRLAAGDSQTSDIELDLGFAPEGAIAALSNGTPDCTFNPGLEPTTSVVYRPLGCTGTACTSIRAAIISTAPHGTLPNGVLFACKIATGLSAGPLSTGSATSSCSMLTATGSLMLAIRKA